MYECTRQGDTERDYYYNPAMNVKQGYIMQFGDTDKSSGYKIHQKAFETLYIDIPAKFTIYRKGIEAYCDLAYKAEFYLVFDARVSGTSNAISTDKMTLISNYNDPTEDIRHIKFKTSGVFNSYEFTAHLQIPPTDTDRDISIYAYCQGSRTGEYSDTTTYMFDNEFSNPIYPEQITVTLAATNLEVSQSDVIRSNSYFTINDLWDNNYNPFDIFLNYCKLYRLVFDIDYINKSISIEPATSYFSNYTIKDWTNKLDMSNTFELKPISFENKYVMFNYSDNDVQLGKDYKEYFGVNYGDIKLITDYNFNTNTQTLMEDLQPTIVYTPNVLSWTTLYDKQKIAYTFGKEIFLNNLDKDEKVVNTFGQFFFVKTATWDKSGDLRNVRITDDTHLQVVTQTYFYSQDTGISLYPTHYKQPTLFYDDKCCLVNIPSKNYTYDKSYMTGKKSIYDLIWSKYIKERYDKNNKIITCYLKLSQYDFANFKFSDFIKINNQIYIINKIYDYNPATTYTTKVELITIQDLKGYTTNNL